MDNFFFEDLDSFIKHLSDEQFGTDPIVQWVFKERIVPLCQKYYQEESKIKKIVSDEILIQQLKSRNTVEFFYNSEFSSREVCRQNFAAGVFRRTYMNIPSDISPKSISVFDERQSYEDYDFPFPDIPLEKVFFDFITERVKFIAKTFKKDFEFNMLYISKLDDLLRNLEIFKVVQVEDLKLLNEPYDKSYIEKRLDSFFEMPLLIGDMDVTNETLIDNFKEKIAELKQISREHKNKKITQVIYEK